MKILAVDLGKFNYVAYFSDSATRKPRFVTVTTQLSLLSTTILVVVLGHRFFITRGARESPVHRFVLSR